MVRRFAFVLLAAGWAAAPAAESAPANPIAGFVVDGGPGPTVQSSYPASGASVPAGVIVLRIAFNQPMTPDAWAYGPVAGADFPKCLAHPRMLSDQRTFVLLCTVAANSTFELQINPAPRFANANGRSARPFTLQFSTTDTEVVNLHDALMRAGLRDEDDPIMTERTAVQGASQTAPPAP